MVKEDVTDGPDRHSEKKAGRYLRLRQGGCRTAVIVASAVLSRGVGRRMLRKNSTFFMRWQFGCNMQAGRAAEDEVQCESSRGI
jgi:hypothetical protein